MTHADGDGRPLSRERIVDRAIAIVDVDGLTERVSAGDVHHVR